MSAKLENFVQKNLSQAHQISERRFYKGDYGASDLLLDLAEAIRLAELTDRQKEVIRLLYLEGLTQAEAGSILNISRQSVAKTESLAIRKIAEIYGDWPKKGEKQD